jgi:hypothetical protein
MYCFPPTGMDKPYLATTFGPYEKPVALLFQSQLGKKFQAIALAV